MHKVKGVQVHRGSDGDCPKNPAKKREQEIKEALLTAKERRRANKAIDSLLEQFRGKRIIDLLLVIRRRFSKIVLTVALERVERRQDELGDEDAIFLAVFKDSLEKSE